ncbi:transcription elongation factor GreA [Candidatus Saccharibacteria bacterium QS_5_54_17]|nr:MAG: transcription elongation factor GreA [Candidatus Saccharibacteria bacterium QS_5_54_17]
MTKQHQLTESGLEEIRQELEELKQRRGDVAERLKTAKAEGDLSENADYDAALEEQEYVEGRINEIEDIILNASIINAPQKKDVVELGNTVELKDDGETYTYTVVGSLESDPVAGKISEESPIGRALIGAKTGDTVTIQTPGGERECEVTKIS